MSLWSRIERRIGELAGELLPDEHRERLTEARGALDGGDAKRAVAICERLILDRPGHAGTLLVLGAARLQGGDAAGALRAFDDAIEADDATPEAHAGRGEALRLLGRFEDAVGAYQAAVRRAGGDEHLLAEAYRGQGLAHRAGGDLDRAIRELRKAVTEAPGDAVALAALGEALLIAAPPAPERARRYLERAVTAADVPPDAHVSLGRAALAMGDTAAAEQAFARARAIAEVDEDRLRAVAAAALAGLGDIARLRGDRAGAHEHYVRALALTPRDATLHERAGDLSADARDWEAAMLRYERAVDLGGAAAAVRKGLDAALALGPGAGERAGFFANRVLERDPRDPHALAARAAALPAEAARATLQGALADSDDPELHLALARVALTQGEREEAATHAWAALRAAPRDQRARDVLAAARAPALEPAPGDDAGELYALALAVQRALADEPALADLLPEAAQAAADFDQPLLVTVMGEFSSGKSTFINALVTEDIAPVGITPTTATINVVKFGRERGGRILYRDGRVATLPWPALSATLQQLDGDAARDVAQVEILYPAPELERVSVVDTPGLNSILPEHEEVARGFIARADAVVWVFAAGQAGKASEREALERIRAEGTRVLGVLNKIDQLSADDVAELRTHLGGELGGLVEAVVPLSARNALAHRAHGAADDGNWPELAAALEERFYSRAREIKRDACRRRLGGLLASARARVQDRRAAAATAADSLGREAAAAREAARTFAAEVVPGVRGELGERASDLYRRAAREVLELVRPRRLPFGSHTASEADRDYLLALLDAGYTALLAPAAARVAGALRETGLRAAAAAAREAAVIGGEPAAALARETEAAIESVDAEVFARADAFVRGYLRGGAIDRFFRQDVPKLELAEDAAYHALYRGSPDLDTEIARPLADAGARALGRIADRLEQLAGWADAQAFELERGAGARLDALDRRRRALSAPGASG